MFLVALAAIAMVALAGLGVKWLLEFQHRASRITWREFKIGMAISPVVAALVAWAGWAMARQSKLTFS